MNAPALVFHLPTPTAVPPPQLPAPQGHPLVNAYPDESIATPAPGAAIVLSGQLKRGIDTLYHQMGALPAITNQQTFDLVRAVVKDASTMRRHVEASRQSAKRPFLDIGSAIDAVARPFIERLDALIKEGKDQERDYLIEEQRRRDEAERARQAAEALALQDTSRPTAPLVPVVVLNEVTAPLQTRNEVVVVDELKYLMLDMVKIRREALEGVVIPGVEVRRITDVVAR